MRPTDAAHPIRVMLVDNQSLILNGFARIIDAQPDMTVIATATSGETAIHTARQSKPDVILMDVRMPGLDGIQATRIITHDLPGIRIIGLTSYDTDAYAIGMIGAGASGFILKDTAAERFLDAIRAAAAGNTVMDTVTMSRLNQRLANTASPARPPASMQTEGNASSAGSDDLPDFTRRERDILAHIVQGDSNEQIAQRLNVSISTVKTHVGNILKKTGQTNRVRLIVWAGQHLNTV